MFLERAVGHYDQVLILGYNKDGHMESYVTSGLTQGGSFVVVGMLQSQPFG